MGRRRDAALAALVLVPAAVVAAWYGAPASPVAAVAGAAGTLALEAVLTVRADRVRAVWSHPAVQVGSVVAVCVGTAAGVALVGPAALTALVSGITTYLLLLASAAVADRRAG